MTDQDHTSQATTIPDIAYWSPEQVRDYLDRVFPLLDEMGAALEACVSALRAPIGDTAQVANALSQASDPLSRYRELRGQR